MNLVFWLAAAGVGVVIVFLMVREARRRHLEELRATWGVKPHREYRLDEIVECHRSRLAARNEPLALDDRTWDDLIMDDVFQRVDHTGSTLGRDALYHRLRVAHSEAALTAFEALVTRMSVDPASRVRTQRALGRLQDPHGYNLWWLSGSDTINVPAWYVVFPLLMVVILGLIPVVVLRFDLLPALLAALGISFVLHVMTFRQVDSLSRAFRQVAPIVTAGQRLLFLRGDDIDPLVSPLSRHVGSLSRLKTISRWISGDPLMLSVQPGVAAVMLSDLIIGIYDYANLLLPLNVSGMYFGVHQLRTSAHALLDVMSALGDVDAAVSVAALRVGQSGWTRPVFGPPRSPIGMSGAVHPLVANAVANSVALQPGTGLLVTGSNMSGKTTFLRTLGVTAVLAQSLHTCFGSEYAAPRITVRSCIGRADDLLAGKSYYLVEVEALLGLVRASDSPTTHLFLLDEMFRGTNAVERIAAGQSVLTELVDGGKPHVVVAATHDNELVDLLATLYAPFHFGDALTDDTLTFDYQLRTGRATSRNAIALLRLNGAPAALVERALASAAELDRQRSGSA